MSTQKELRILIVDDSIIYRRAIEKAFDEISDVRVVGSVWNGRKAIDYLLNNEPPDLITLDVEMPEMDGLETLKEIRSLIKQGKIKENSFRVLMISSLTSEGATTTIEALQNGAFDFILKPRTSDPNESFEALKEELSQKIQQITKSQSKPTSSEKQHVPPPPVRNTGYKEIQAIAIGVSTGGPRALIELLPELCDHLKIPIFVVQHMPPEFTKSLAENLDKRCKYSVVEAIDNQVVKPEKIYIAPGGHHLIVRHNQQGQVVTSLSDNPPENGSRPSVDVLFRSLSATYGGNMIGVILTGMGSDGSKSLRKLKRNGSPIIAQDEETSVVWGMPKSAIDTECVDIVLPLNKIGNEVIRIVNTKNQ